MKGHAGLASKLTNLQTEFNNLPEHPETLTSKVTRPSGDMLESIIDQTLETTTNYRYHYSIGRDSLGQVIHFGNTKWRVVHVEMTKNAYLILDELPEDLDADYYRCTYDKIEDRMESFWQYFKTQISDNYSKILNGSTPIRDDGDWTYLLLPTYTNVAKRISGVTDSSPWWSRSYRDHLLYFPDTDSTHQVRNIYYYFVGEYSLGSWWLNSLLQIDEQIFFYFYVSSSGATYNAVTSVEEITGRHYIRPMISISYDNFYKFVPKNNIRSHRHDVHEVTAYGQSVASWIENVIGGVVPFYVSNDISSKSIDLDTYTSNGAYRKYTGNTSNFTEVLNGPGDISTAQWRAWSNGFALYVLSPSGGMSGMILQILVVPEARRFYTRYSTSSGNTRTWKEWMKYSAQSIL